MRFELRHPHVFFHDDKPGNHVTVFASDGRKLPFLVEASRFDDRARKYAWAFDAEGAAPGAFIVFASADREVVGVLGGAGCVLGNFGEHVVRDIGGKPLRLVAPRGSAQVVPTPETREVGFRVSGAKISAAARASEYPPGWPPPVLARDLE